MNDADYVKYAAVFRNFGVNAREANCRVVAFENGVVLFKDRPEDRRFAIDVRSSEKGKLFLRIRTAGTKNAHRGGVSGCVIEDETGQLFLLHRPERVHDNTRLPQLSNALKFDDKIWSSFPVTSELPRSLYDYAFSRPANDINGGRNG